MFKKDFSLKVLVVVFFIVSLSILVSGLLVLESQQGTTYERLYPSNDSGYRYIQTIDSNYIAIANKGGTPKRLFNTGTRDLFVPLNSAGEWNLFLNAASGLGVQTRTFCGDGYCNKDYVSVNSYNTETCYNCSTDCGGCSCNSGSTCPTGEYCAGLDYYCKDYAGLDGAQCRYHSNQYNCESEYGCEWSIRGTGTCTPGACIPNCVGKVCGDDGCGGSCGASCAWNRYCSSGQCILKCGDGFCTSPENPTNCIADCPHTCGDGYCTGSETCSSCPGDCGTCGPVCGNGYCESGEDCWSCSLDCGGCICDSPDQCPSGETCQGYDASCRDYGGMGGCYGNTTRSSCENNPGCEWEVWNDGTCSR